jgi:peroxiredoxin
VKANKSGFDRRGVSVVVVSFAEPGKLARYQSLNQWPFTLLADPDRAAYQAFTLKRLSWLRVFSLSTLKLYWKLRRSGHQQQDYGREDIYQAGGDFLLDRAGKVLFAQRSQEPSDRPTARQLLDVIDRVKRVRESL